MKYRTEYRTHKKSYAFQIENNFQIKIQNYTFIYINFYDLVICLFIESKLYDLIN